MSSTSSPLNPTNPQLSVQDVEKMRNLVLEHDRSQAHKVTDLSKPPVVPYVFKKFPMTVYDHSKNQPAHERVIKNQLGQEQTEHVPWKCATKLVHSEEELGQAIQEGWDPKPPADKYSSEKRYATGDTTEVDEFMRSQAQALPDFTDWNKERLIAYALAMFELEIPSTTKRDEIIGQIEQAHESQQ